MESTAFSGIWRSLCLEQVCSLAPAQHGSCATTCLDRCAWRSGELGWAEVDRDLWWRGREEEEEVRTAAAEAVEAQDPGVLRLGGETSTNPFLKPPHRGWERSVKCMLERSSWRDGWTDMELQQKLQHNVVLNGVDDAGWVLQELGVVRSTLFFIIQHKDKLETSH